MIEPYGARKPGWLDSKVIHATSRLPNNWLGLRIAIGTRRIVTSRLPDDNGLDVVRWGVRLRLHPRCNMCEKGALFTPQMYEVPERAELRSEIEKAKSVSRAFVFIDIGANVGLFSFFVASCASPNAKIIAIEPDPENLRRLQFNVAANPGIPIRVLPLALGETAGKVVLQIDDSDRGSTRTRPLSAEFPTSGPIVECRSLLSILKEEVTYVDALKIDVEGNEDAILSTFFREADASLWPKLIIVEDVSGRVSSELTRHGYAIETRTKLNIVMRRSVG
jgi:FkbM family methyltransferase